MKPRLPIAAGLLLALALAFAPAAPVLALPRQSQLPAPGETAVFEQTIPINLVFVGYEASQVDADAVLAGLPGGYTPVVRYPQFYGLPGRDMGLQFNFTYNPIFTNQQFENRFFRFLRQQGYPGPLTLYQQAYNDQASNILDVSDEVLYIEATRVENELLWMARNMLGLDTRHSYTVFFINWYSRPDFKFHVYVKADEPDPDTGYNFGDLRASRKLIAWGGTNGRAWFYDLSAGPEAWTSNWVVDFDDLDGNGAADYRMPPIWEYAAGGYRDPADLSADLGLVTRFVAINLLFTTSPLYDPLVTAPGPNGHKVLHMEMLQDDPASNGLDWVDASKIFAPLANFQSYYNWQVNIEDNNPIDAAAQRALQIFSGVLAEDDCWNDFGTPFAELFCFFTANRDNYVPAYAPEDYVGVEWAFNTTAATLGDQFGLLGFADDNWIDGTQSMVFVFGAEEYRALGYGFTTTAVHEFGHHLGMSHPHDGYDSEYGFDYGPGDFFYFAWSGDESHTVMHYMDLATGFGQFDRDNLHRYEFAGYANWASELMGALQGYPQAARDLARARALLGRAEGAFDAWNYEQAARQAYSAYNLLLVRADLLGVSTGTMSALRAAPAGQAPHEGDPIRFPND